MTNQPYEGPYGDSAPYRQQPWQGHAQDPDDPHAAQHTQQWQGRTWETRLQPPVSAEETAYLPPQSQEPPAGPHGGYDPGHHPTPPPHGHDPHASQGHGTYAQAPGGYGVRAQAPETYGTRAQGPEAYGTRAQGPETYGTRAQARETYGTQAQGPEAYGTQAQASQGYGAQASQGYGGQASPGYGTQAQGVPQGYGGHAQGQPHGQGAPQAHDPHAQGQGQSHGYGVRRQPQPEPQPHPQHQASYAQAYQQSPAAGSPSPAASATATAPGEDGEAPSYGPATLAGNTRVTDAQRARAEGRSPIIDPGMQPAALTALLGLLLSGAAAIGTYALLVPLVVLQAVTSAGWFRLNGMWPARQGIALGFAGALAADVALLASDRSPAAILGTLGVWVLLTLVLQLRSHADPDERMYGLMATVAAAALAIVAGGWLAADADAVSVGAAGVAVAVLARSLPLPTPASVVVALLAAAGAGIAVGQLTGLGASGALLGGGAAVCALIGHRVAAYDYPSRFVHFTAGVALPLAAAAPAVYVLGRALV